MLLITPQISPDAEARNITRDIRRLSDVMSSISFYENDTAVLYLLNQSLKAAYEDKNDVLSKIFSDTAQSLLMRNAFNGLSSLNETDFTSYIGSLKTCWEKLSQAQITLYELDVPEVALSMAETLLATVETAGYIHQDTKTTLYKSFDNWLQERLYIRTSNVKKEITHIIMPLSNIYKTIGDCRITNGDLEGALTAYQQARKQSPTNISAICSYAETQRALGNPDKALKSTIGGINLSTTREDISVCHLVAARCLVDMGLASEASACAQIAIWSDPDEAAGIDGLGVKDVIKTICDATGYGGDIVLEIADEGLSTEEMPRRSAESVIALRESVKIARNSNDKYALISACDALGCATGSVELCEEAVAVSGEILYNELVEKQIEDSATKPGNEKNDARPAKRSGSRSFFKELFTKK